MNRSKYSTVLLLLLYTCPVDRSSNPVGGKLFAEDKSVASYKAHSLLQLYTFCYNTIHSL